MEHEMAKHVRRLTQHYAYISLQMHEAVARKAGIPGTDHKYLGFLLKKEKMTAGELATLTGLTTGAVTGLIDRMEKKKLVKRQFADDDRRKVFIEPNTENIMALMEPLYKEFRGNTEKLIASFSNKELKVLETYFSKAIEVMTDATNKLNKKK
jgi:DNA-binding MarR family transcriptional regulator